MELKIKDFYADWCGPCRTLSPILEEINKEIGIEVEKINVDNNDEVAETYNIRNIPTLVFEKNGVEIKRTIGVVPKDKLLEIIETLK